MKVVWDEVMVVLVEVCEEFDVLEWVKCVEDEVMVEVMKMMDERRARDDDARRRRFDETRVVIEFEFDVCVMMREY